MKNKGLVIKISAIFVVVLVTLLAAASVEPAMKIPTAYSLDQFLPRNHELLKRDQESKKVFHISEFSPHILVLSQRETKTDWLASKNLKKLKKLSDKFSAYKEVDQVISIANVETALSKKDSLAFGTVAELQSSGLSKKSVLQSPLFAPQLLSGDGQHTVLFVVPHEISTRQHADLSYRLISEARKEFPGTKVRIGGPAPIRTELIQLLSKEILLFIVLSLLGALIVLKMMFRGWSMVLPIIYIITVANLLSLAAMSLLNISFNLLTSTIPILVTLCALGVCGHTLIRLSQVPVRGNRISTLLALMKYLAGPHAFAAMTTTVGFATLMLSDVPLIFDYGLGVSVAVALSSGISIALVTCIYMWAPWPEPKKWLGEKRNWSVWLTRNARKIVPGVAFASVIFFLLGLNLSWTARIFDDLPDSHSTKRTTDFIGEHLGGTVPLDFVIKAKDAKAWKEPAQLVGLEHFSRKWRGDEKVGSILTLADFMSAGSQGRLPAERKALAEIQFLFGMSEANPLPQFLSSDEKWTRVAIRLPDLPATENQHLVAAMTKDLQKIFPNTKVEASGFAAIVPTVNEDLSKRLMWGFFEALFAIVILLTVVFRSLKWALFSIVPNLVPPALLLGCLALFDISIKPGIAMIFSISLGIAFDNTIYMLGRLKELLKSGKFHRRLPIPRLVAMESTPCLVSSISILCGFSIFLFSHFPVNQMFGVFMLVTVFAGLLGDLVWLPALLHRFPWLLLDRSKNANLLGRPAWMESAMKISPYVLFIALGLMTAFASKAEQVTPASIFKEVEKRTSPPNERARLKMVIVESDGSTKERWMSISRRNSKEDQRALVRLEKPSDLEGLALLSVNTDSKEDQWLYLPSTKKSRRILGSNKKGKFLDSEISYEDLRVSTYQDFNNKVVSRSPANVQLESLAKPGSDSSYSKVKTWVSLPDYKIEKMEYYDGEGKLLKTTEFKGYQKFGKKYWRAKVMEVNNLQTKRRTKLELKGLSLKPLKEDDVSLDALED